MRRRFKSCCPLILFCCTLRTTLAKRAAVETISPGYSITTKSGKHLGGGTDLIDCLQLMREHTQPMKLIRNADSVMLAFTTGTYEKRERKAKA